jgi:hypothetical protein
MSEYSYRDDGPRRHRSVRTRERDPEFIEETTYIQRGGGGAPIRDLVYRPRDDSIEDIERDFPPPRGKPARRPRSVGRREYYEDDYSDYYETRRRGRPSRRDSEGYWSEDYDRPPRRERRKSRVGEVLEDLGLGGVAGAFLGSKARSHSRSRTDRYDRDRYDRRRYSSSSSRSRSRSRGGDRRGKWEQAAKAAVVAGAVEAFRSRKTPGAWAGEKGTRVATAALSAAGIDGMIDKNPDHHSKRHIAESAIGGLVSNRLVNGSRSASRARARSASTDGYSRSRSRGRSIVDRFRSASRGRSQSRGRSESRGGGLKNLAAGGALAAAGKAIYDRVRSKSRRRRSPSSSSTDSYVPTRGRRYRGDDRDYGTGNDSYNQDAAGTENGTMMRGGGSTRAASVSSESTTDMEQRTKRMRGKELLTAGLATVATIHAVHGVYNSINASEKRHKLVAEGEMSPTEARKKRSKAFLQDAAAIGIAALGVKGAFSEWKEMNEHRQTVKELELKKRKRKKMRERRAKELRQQNLLGGPYGYGSPMGVPAGGYAMGPSTYADANPYSAGNLPAPPMGGPPSRY